MTSRNFQKSMFNQDQEIIFEVVKVSGEWLFPAASSIVEATRGKNMYLRLTDDGKSDIFRLDSVKDGENAGETVFGFVGNGGMDLVELTATTDGTGTTTGSWDYEPGEGPAGEAIGNLGQPLQWKGHATVSELNAGITGIQPGWTYTLTDAGTLTDGSITVDVGDEVAWSAESSKWVKIGGDAGKVTIYDVTLSSTTWTYPDASKIDFDIGQGKYVVLKFNDGTATSFYFLMSGPASTSATSKSIQFFNFSTKGALLASYASNTWSWSANDYSPYPVFTGSTPGLVPTATAGDASKALKGDGTWGTVSTVTVSYDSVAEQLWLDFKDHSNEVLIGGRWYKTVTIGNQVWLAENLNYKWSGLTIGGSGTPTTPNAWYYNNDEATYGIDGTYKCGLLYNWYAAKYLNDNRANLIPGWHVPTKDELVALADACGGKSTAGTKLKALDNSVVSGFPSGWNGTDDYGFNAVPAGSYSGSFSDIGSKIDFWTSEEAGGGYYWYFGLDTGPRVNPYSYNGNYAHSIRLVKDNT